MNADYHHIPKVLDLVAAVDPTSILETHDGTPVFAPLCRSFLHGISRVDDATSEEAHSRRTRADLVIVRLEAKEERHAALDHVRALLSKNRGVLVIASKPDWEKAEIAALGPALFVNDPRGIIAYVGKSEDIKRIRRRLLKGRVRRMRGRA